MNLQEGYLEEDLFPKLFTNGGFRMELRKINTNIFI